MCDRIVIFAANPGRVAAEIKINLKHPRSRDDPKFRTLVDEVYIRLTKPFETTGAHAGQGAATQAGGIGMILPEVSPNSIAGMKELLPVAMMSLRMASARLNGGRRAPHPPRALSPVLGGTRGLHERGGGGGDAGRRHHLGSLCGGFRV